MESSMLKSKDIPRPQEILKLLFDLKSIKYMFYIGCKDYTFSYNHKHEGNTRYFRVNEAADIWILIKDMLSVIPDFKYSLIKLSENLYTISYIDFIYIDGFVFGHSSVNVDLAKKDFFRKIIQ